MKLPSSGLIGQSLSPQQAMQIAIGEARKGQGFVAPNPLVGAVVLDSQNRLLSFGHHARCGGQHAEVVALEKIPLEKRNSLLKGAQVYVTLEPCAHQGRTPSCAHELAKWPIAKLIYGLEDPNPKVSGRGVEILRQSGVVCEQAAFFGEELEDLAEVFLTNMRDQTCFVALKVATGLDGHLAMRDGKSQWISNEKSRRHVQYLRGIYDAVLVGSQTFLLDQPKLNSRHPRFKSKTNALVILDPQAVVLDKFLKSPASQVRSPPQMILVISRFWSEKKSQAEAIQVKKAMGQLMDVGVKILFYEERDPGLGLGPGLDLAWLKAELYKLGLTSLLVEGGAQTHSTFLQQGVVDRIYQFVAPILLGGANALNWTQSLQICDFSQRVALQRVQFFRLGDNVLVTGRLLR